MDHELIRAIKNIKDEAVIKNMIVNMNVKDIPDLLSLLQLTDETTRQLWLSIYLEVLSEYVKYERRD